jgi:hypothetical protein
MRTLLNLVHAGPTKQHHHLRLEKSPGLSLSGQAGFSMKHCPYYKHRESKHALPGRSFEMSLTSVEGQKVDCFKSAQL